jgi:hypothetical protein
MGDAISAGHGLRLDDIFVRRAEFQPAQRDDSHCRLKFRNLCLGFSAICAASEARSQTEFLHFSGEEQKYVQKI